jgi:hypothetical protein
MGARWHLLGDAWHMAPGDSPMRKHTVSRQLPHGFHSTWLPCSSHGSHGVHMAPASCHMAHLWCHAPPMQLPLGAILLPNGSHMAPQGSHMGHVALTRCKRLTVTTSINGQNYHWHHSTVISDASSCNCNNLAFFVVARAERRVTVTVMLQTPIAMTPSNRSLASLTLGSAGTAAKQSGLVCNGQPSERARGLLGLGRGDRRRTSVFSAATCLRLC